MDGFQVPDVCELQQWPQGMGLVLLLLLLLSLPGNPIAVTKLLRAVVVLTKRAYKPVPGVEGSAPIRIDGIFTCNIPAFRLTVTGFCRVVPFATNRPRPM